VNNVIVLLHLVTVYRAVADICASVQNPRFLRSQVI